MQFACRVCKARTQTHTHNMWYLLLLHGSNHSANAPQSYVIRTLPFYICQWRSNISFFPLYFIALFSFVTWRYFHVVNRLYFFRSVSRYCCRERLKHSIVCSGIHSPYYYIKFRGFCLQLYTVTWNKGGRPSAVKQSISNLAGIIFL